MKKYIQPTCEAMNLQMEAVIAASLTINGGGTSAEPLSNERGGWSAEDWDSAEEEEF